MFCSHSGKIILSSYHKFLIWLELLNSFLLIHFKMTFLMIDDDLCQLQGLCHPLHLPNKSDAVMEGATWWWNKFWEIEPGTLGTRVKDLNHCTILLLNIYCSNLCSTGNPGCPLNYCKQLWPHSFFEHTQRRILSKQQNTP